MSYQIALLAFGDCNASEQSSTGAASCWTLFKLFGAMHMQPSLLVRLLAASVFGGRCRSSAESAPSTPSPGGIQTAQHCCEHSRHRCIDGSACWWW